MRQSGNRKVVPSYNNIIYTSSSIGPTARVSQNDQLLKCVINVLALKYINIDHSVKAIPQNISCHKQVNDGKVLILLCGLHNF